jgi:Integrase zinc binding domain
VITTRVSTWKPNPTFPNDKSDGWMLWSNLTTESNTTKNNGTSSVTPFPGYQTFLRRNYSPGRRQASDENVRLKRLTATGIQIDDSVKNALIHDYTNDPAFSRHILQPELHFEVRGGMIYKDGKLCVPIGKVRQTLMQDAHDSIVAGHLGIDKTIASIRKMFEWGGMSKDIAEYVRSCDRCQQNKPAPSKPIGLLQPLEVPSRNWEHVTMDFIMDLPKTKAGHDAVLVVVDKLSKAMTLIPTKSSVTAQQVAQLFLKEVYRLHGLPRKIISDRDVRFTGRFWQELHEIGDVVVISSAN